MANLVHPEISELLDDQLRPELLYRTRRGRDRPATRGVITSSSTLADFLKGGGQHEEISSVTFPSMATVPPTDEGILVNQAELVQWDAYKKELYSVLFLCGKKRRQQLLVHFEGRPGSRQQPDNRQATWRAIGEKYLNSLMRVEMRKLDGMTMTPNHDP